MRYIPTTEALIEKFKQAAHKMKRSATMKQSEALNRVARTYGYNSWGHVKCCLDESNLRISRGQSIKADLIDPLELSFNGEVEHIIHYAEIGAQTVVCLKTCILFSTFDNDAWLLDASTNQALCLVWRGQRQTFRIMETTDSFAVEYDAEFSIADDNFIVNSDNPAIGHRVIGISYPTDEISYFADGIRRRAGIHQA